MSPTRASRLALGDHVRLVHHPDANHDYAARVIAVRADGTVDVLQPQSPTFAKATSARAYQLRPA